MGVDCYLVMKLADGKLLHVMLDRWHQWQTVVEDGDWIAPGELISRIGHEIEYPVIERGDDAKLHWFGLALMAIYDHRPALVMILSETEQELGVDIGEEVMYDIRHWETP